MNVTVNVVQIKKIIYNILNGKMNLKNNILYQNHLDKNVNNQGRLNINFNMWGYSFMLLNNLFYYNNFSPSKIKTFILFLYSTCISFLTL